MASKPWKKPRSKEQIQRVLRKLRDAFLGDFVFKLDRQHPYVISFDGKEPERPIQVLWDLAIEDSATWSNQFGCIGRICVVHEQGQPIAMAQAGGVIVPPEAASEIPKDSVVLRRRITVDGERNDVLLVALTVDYFLTARALESYGRGPAGQPQLLFSEIMKNKKSEWHSVDNVKAWKAVLARMTRRHTLSAEDLDDLRSIDGCG